MKICILEFYRRMSFLLWTNYLEISSVFYETASGKSLYLKEYGLTKDWTRANDFAARQANC